MSANYSVLPTVSGKSGDPGTPPEKKRPWRPPAIIRATDAGMCDVSKTVHVSGDSHSYVSTYYGS